MWCEYISMKSCLQRVSCNDIAKIALIESCPLLVAWWDSCSRAAWFFSTRMIQIISWLHSQYLAGHDWLWIVMWRALILHTAHAVLLFYLVLPLLKLTASMLEHSNPLQSESTVCFPNGLSYTSNLRELQFASNLPSLKSLAYNGSFLIICHSIR